MFDIGIGEVLLLAVLGLLVFGPEKLPKAAADAGRWLRQLRQMAASARSDLASSAGVDLTDAKDALREISDLHPKRIAASLLREDDAKPATPATPAKPATQPSPTPFDPDAT